MPPVEKPGLDFHPTTAIIATMQHLKKHTMKNLNISVFALILSSLLLTSCAVHRGYCGADADSRNVQWKLSCGTLSIKGNGHMKDYENWTDSVRAPWYAHRNLIRRAVIRRGVTSVGAHAFSECNRMRKISIASSVSSLNDHSFNSCISLRSIKFREGLASIGYRAFENCSSLSGEISLPASLSSFGKYTFLRCPHIEKISVPDSNRHYTAAGNILYNKDMTTLIYCPAGVKGSIAVPDGVWSIAPFAFEGCSRLTRIQLPAGLLSVGHYAFADCSSLSDTMSLPESVIHIGEGIFEGCSSLEEITLPDHLTAIPHSTFGQCSSLRKINLPEHTKAVEEIAFLNCKRLTTITVHDSLDYIKNRAFEGCSALDSFTVDSVSVRYKAIDGALYDSTETVLLRYPTGRRGTLSISGKTQRIGNLAFADCALLSGTAVIPDSVVQIDEMAFSGCSLLDTVRIGSGIRQLHSTSFSGCTNIKEIHLECRTPPEIITYWYTRKEGLSGIDSEKCRLVVPRGTKASYQGTKGWDKFKVIIEAEH